MKGHLFPAEVEAGFFAGYQCRRCEGTRRLLDVCFPRIQRCGDEIALTYPIKCSCGAPGSVRFRIPILLYAYARVWLELAKGTRAKVGIRQYPLDGPHCFRSVIRDYHTILAQHRSEPSDQPTDVDRLLLGFGHEVWREFIKRGELESHEDDDETTEEEDEEENE